MEVVIIHADEGNEAEIHGAVLVDTAEEAKHAEYSARQWLREYESDDATPEMYEWLASKGFKPIELREVFL